MGVEQTRPLRTRSALRVAFRRSLPDDSIDEPMLVWVRSDDTDAERALRESLDDDRISLALRGFRTVKVDAGEIESGSRLDRGRDVPRLLVVRPANGRVDALTGRALESDRIYATLRRVANEAYEERVGALIRESRPLIETLDELGRREQELRSAKAKLDPDVSRDARRARKLEVELDEIVAELDEAEAQLDELWTLTLRS